MLELSTETWWKLAELGGNWLSGIGSLAAVVVALMLARDQRRARLVIRAKASRYIRDGLKPPFPLYAHVNVTNLGHRPVTVSSYGWQIGFLRKQYGYQKDLGNFPSTHLPHELTVGRDADLMVRIDQGGWLRHMVEEIGGRPFPILALYSIKVVISTAGGKFVKKRLDKSLRDEIRAAYLRKKAGGKILPLPEDSAAKE